MKMAAKLISAHTKMLAKESKLLPRQSGWTVQKCLGDRAVDGRHSRNVNVGVAAFLAISYLDIL
jgi:hypothetical protein